MVSSIGSSGTINSYNSSQVQKRQQLRVEDLLNNIDSNGDGSVSEDEFISNRPQEVSEDQSKQLWSQVDSNNAGSLTGNQFLSALDSLKPPMGLPVNDLQSSSESSSSVSSLSSNSDSDVSSGLINAILNAIKQYAASTGQISSTTTNDTPTSSVSTDRSQLFGDIFSKVDTDGNGSISQDEFISDRPEDVSENQAKQRWNQLDTSNSGSITKDQFVTGMTKQEPLPGGFGTLDDSGSASTASSSSATSKSNASDELVMALLKAIKEYTTTNQSGLSSAGTMATASSLTTTA